MLEPTYFFYDLETSGTDPRKQRVMQFAGQRTTMDFKPVGKPYNVLVRLADDVLPDPMAILITGITPQSVSKGLNEADFAKLLQNEVCTPGTIMTGFNSVRFDDEFLRFLFYRNLYDPYDWCWRDERSRWDLLDVVRMTRALRPDGITWPFAKDGRPINKLELLSAANGLEHTKAHDALSDVEALIGVTALLRQKQPKLYDYLLGMRGKKAVTELIEKPAPFMYASGRYPITDHHTTAAVVIGEGARAGAKLVYDLRHNPADYANMSVDELKALRFAPKEARKQADYKPFPAKELVTNRCPAVAPLGVLTPEAETNIKLTKAQVQANYQALSESDLASKLAEVFKKDREFEPADVDGALYDGFLNDADKELAWHMRSLDPVKMASASPKWSDKRLPELWWRYRARNHPEALTAEERAKWDTQRAERLMQAGPEFARQFDQAFTNADTAARTNLEDLKLWVESMYPLPE